MKTTSVQMLNVCLEFTYLGIRGTYTHSSDLIGIAIICGFLRVSCV